jgi:adenylate kinase
LFGVPHVASGDILRKIIADQAGTERAREASVIADGSLVSDDLAASVVFGSIATDTGFVLDGFPRNVHQAEMLAAFLAERNVDLDDALALKVGAHALELRLTGRLTCPNCGESYHMVKSPPRRAGVCDRCGVALVTRPDDDLTAIPRRMELYRTRTLPLYGYYERQGLLRTVEADATEDEVFARCRAALRMSGETNESLV